MKKIEAGGRAATRGAQVSYTLCNDRAPSHTVTEHRDKPFGLNRVVRQSAHALERERY
jgi:hypothetical protein